MRIEYRYKYNYNLINYCMRYSETKEERDIQMNIEELDKKCEELNSYIDKRQYESLLCISKLERRCNVLKKVKLALIVFLIIDVLIDIYIIMYNAPHSTGNSLECILFFLILAGVLGVLFFYLARSLIHKINSKISDIKYQLAWLIERLEKEYVDTIFYPYTALAFFDGEYRKDMLKKELEASGLQFPEHFKLYGGMKGIVDGIPFLESYIEMYDTKRNGDTKNEYKGTVFQFVNPKPCLSNVYIGNFGDSITTSEYIPNINIDHPYFREHFFVKSNDAMSAFKILTPKYMEHIIPYIRADGMITEIVYGMEYILILVKHRRVVGDCSPTYPFSVQQCHDSALELSNNKAYFIKEIYNLIIESMR